MIDEDRIDRLTEVYSPPGAFVAAAQWYRSSSNPVTAYATETAPTREDRLTTPTTILWQDRDAIFPASWSDRLDDLFTNYTMEELAGIGHFTPLEATTRFANAIRRQLVVTRNYQKLA